MDHQKTNKPSSLPRGITYGAKTAILAGLLALTVLLSGCAENVTPSAESTCRTALDEAIDDTSWTAAVEACALVVDGNNALTDTGRSLKAQALMGRAGVSMIGLLEKLTGAKNINGLSLMLSIFTIDLATELPRYNDVSEAVTLLNGISCFTDPNVECKDVDTFNITIASDVVLTTLFANSLGMLYCDQTKVDAGSCASADLDTLIIPGITDAGLAGLTDPTDSAAVTAVLNNIYTTPGSYYTTAPLVWENTTANVDLKRLSTFVQANLRGAKSLGIGVDTAMDELKPLAFGLQIDNGSCGYTATVDVSAPAATDTTDGAVAVGMFPRRLDTTSALTLANDLLYVMLDAAGTADATKEWGGTFKLPSALVNPDHLAPALTTANFPYVFDDGNPATDDSATNGAAAKTEFAAGLDAAYPINNAADPTAATFDAATGIPCKKGDGWVHAREYDHYLRSLGQ